MKVIVIKKEPFGVIQHDNVTNIALLSGYYVITTGQSNYSYSKADYTIMIL